jgi:hypothetical protein
MGLAQSAGPAAGSVSGNRAAADITERIVNKNESIVKVLESWAAETKTAGRREPVVYQDDHTRTCVVDDNPF